MEESSSPLCECVLSMLHHSPIWLSPAGIISVDLPNLHCSHCLSLHPMHAWGIDGKCPSGIFSLNTQETNASSEENGYNLLLILLCFCLRKMFPNWRAGAHSCGAFCVDTNTASHASQRVSLFTVQGLGLESYLHRKCVVAKSSYTPAKYPYFVKKNYPAQSIIN